MLRHGLARPSFVEPNYKYKEPYYKAAEEAKNKRIKIWRDLDSISSPDGNSLFVIDPYGSPRYEDKRMVVKGEIISVRRSDKVIVFLMDGKFDVVIFPNDLDYFAFFGTDPAEYYMGRTVEVAGRIKMRKCTPEIVVSRPLLIRSSE